MVASRIVGCFLILASFLRLTLILVSALLVRTRRLIPGGGELDHYFGIGEPLRV